MKKPLKTQYFALSLFLLSLLSCEVEKDLPTNSSHTKNLNQFAETHISISKEIILILNDENELNFDDFEYDYVQNFENEEKFKQALANTGMNKYEQMYDLLLSQNQNAEQFIKNNKDFALLEQETKHF